MRRLLKLVLGLLLISCVLLVPVLPISVVPSWRLRLVDGKNQPIAREPLTQYWQHYSFEFLTFMPNEGKGVTDELGFVTFPERTIRISLAALLVGYLWDRSPKVDPHSASGPYSFVICDKSNCTSPSYRGGGALPDTIVAE